MEQIYPITEEVCGKFIGLPVVAIMNDGAQHYGVISKVRDGKLILNDNGESAGSSGTAKRSKGKSDTVVTTRSRRPRKNGKSASQARLSALPAEELPEYAAPGPYPSLFGEKVALELAGIAALLPMI